MRHDEIVTAYDRWQRAPFDQTLRAAYLRKVEQWQRDHADEACPIHGTGHPGHPCPEMTLPEPTP